MRRLWTIATVVLMVAATPVWAQHGGGGHGGGSSSSGRGFSGYSSGYYSGAARGGFSEGGQFRYSRGAVQQGYRPAVRGFAPGPGAAVRAPIGSPGVSGARSAFYGRGGRDRWRYGYVGGAPYIYPGVYSGWDGYELGDLDDDGSYDTDADDAQGDAAGPAYGYGPGDGYASGPGDAGPAGYAAGYDGPVEGYAAGGPPQGYGEQPPQQTQEEAAQESAAALAQNTSPSLYDDAAVTLVFKDGRPPEKIENYALTRTTVYVTGEHHREIPVADLDIAATEKANRDAGVTFQLPSEQ